jgi:Uma2 family endonuclease
LNRLAPLPPTTAAEGLPRRRFTMAELEQIVAAGIIEEDERIELIGGEVVPMSPKGDRHETLKIALNLYWARKLPEELQFATETTFRLSPDTYLEPDFVFYPKTTIPRRLSQDEYPKTSIPKRLSQDDGGCGPRRGDGIARRRNSGFESSL